MKFKIVTSLILFLAITQKLSAQSNQVRFFIDTTIALMKELSVNTDSVNWADLKKQTLQRVNGVNDSADLQHAMGFLYQFLNDPHGAFRYKAKRYGWFQDMPPVDDSLQKEFDKGDYIKTQMLQNKMGYLRIPTMSYEHKDSLVHCLNESLCHLLENNIKGLVIDLRLNSGGSMSPMILGVKQLLGERTVAGFQTNNKSLTITIKNNGLYTDTAMKLAFKPVCFADATQLSVVLITSFETASSGETLLISFIGRPNTIIIGVPTQGMTSGLVWNKISTDVEIGVAASFTKDRNGTVYKTAIQPDIYLDALNKMNDISLDSKVMAAVRWLTSHTK